MQEKNTSTPLSFYVDQYISLKRSNTTYYLIAGGAGCGLLVMVAIIFILSHKKRKNMTPHAIPGKITNEML